MHIKKCKICTKNCQNMHWKHQYMHLKTPKYLQQTSKLLKIRAYLLRPCIPNFNRTFELVFESEWVFRDFRILSWMSFFRNFWKVRNFQIFKISKISEHLEKPVSEISKLFPKIFLNFSKLFDRKTGFFALKPQILHHFFEIFEIYVHFQIITELFSELKFPNFFPNFFAKIPRVRKFRFFPKNFRTLKTEHFRNSRKWKVRKFPSNAGPYSKGLMIRSSQNFSMI